MKLFFGLDGSIGWDGGLIMAQGTAKKHHEALKDIVDDYRAAGKPWPAAMRDVAEYAIRTRRWEPQATQMVSVCARALSRALRDETFVDDSGRSVRVMHAARVVEVDAHGVERQLVLWQDIREASPEHMELSFRQRREQILGACRQLKSDVDGYNASQVGRPVQLTFNFQADLEEQTSAAEIAAAFSAPLAKAARLTEVEPPRTGNRRPRQPR